MELRHVLPSVAAAVCAVACAGSRVAPNEVGTGVDGGSDAEAAHDAADAAEDVAEDAVADAQPPDSLQPACDASAPFGTPVLLPGVNTSSQQGGPRLTADELTLYFSQTSGSVSNIVVAHRASTTAPFGPPTPLATLDSTFDEYDPSTTTELTIFFTKEDRPGADDIWVSTRSNVADPFAAPSALPAPLNSGSSDAEPFLRADGSELWFASDRPGGVGGAGNYDLYRAAQAGTSFASPQLVTELSVSGTDTFTPTLSADGLTVFFSSTRTDGGAQGAEDIWTASRASATDPFSNIEDVSAVNSTSPDFPGWLSADGCRLYMSSYRSGIEEIYLATRGP